MLDVARTDIDVKRSLIGEVFRMFGGVMLDVARTDVEGIRACACR